MIMQGNPTLTLIRGLPGSGKSTIAKLLASGGANHYEADMYFIDDHGQYKFDQNQIAQAHEWCQHQTRLELECGESAIVSNTFTTWRELRPYYEIAAEFGVTPSVILMQNNYGNIHDVPEVSLQRMRGRFTYDLTPIIAEFNNNRRLKESEVQS